MRLLQCQSGGREDDEYSGAVQADDHIVEGDPGLNLLDGNKTFSFPSRIVRQEQDVFYESSMRFAFAFDEALLVQGGGGVGEVQGWDQVDRVRGDLWPD